MSQDQPNCHQSSSSMTFQQQPFHHNKSQHFTDIYDESWFIWHSIAMLYFLPWGTVISGNIEMIHICSMQTLQWCLTRPNAWSSFVLLPYLLRSSHGISYNLYADDTLELIVSFLFINSQGFCSLTDILSWMAAYKLKFKPRKSDPLRHFPMSRSTDPFEQLSDGTICHCRQPWGNHGQSAVLLVSDH